MFELRVLCPENSVELICDALEALDALSVSVQDANADTDAENALFGEPNMPAPKQGWDRSLVCALYEASSKAQQALHILQAQDFFTHCQFLDILPVPDQDWVRLTQSQFEPVCITDDFWIVPSWHEVPQNAKQFIRLDPGLAFGTGTHPTTFMCLKWLATHPQALIRKRVLDYGCGSGILAIGAAKYEAQRIDAVDIDEAAIEASTANALINRVTIHAQLPHTLCNDSSDPHFRYDVVLANILASPLKVLAPLLCQRVAQGGQLVLAGILERQADELQQAYHPYCLPHAPLKVLDTRDGWVLMGTKF